MLQSTHPRRLNDKKDLRKDAWIFLERENRIDFEGVLGEGWMGTDGIRLSAVEAEGLSNISFLETHAS